MSKHMPRLLLLLLLTATTLMAIVPTSSASASIASVDYDDDADDANAAAPIPSRYDASRNPKHFVVDARDVLADPMATFLSWSAHYSRPVVVGGDDVEQEQEQELSERERPARRSERARFDAWASNVLPRARRALSTAAAAAAAVKGGGETGGNLPPSADTTLLEVNGIADLPLSTLRAGLLPAKGKEGGRGASDSDSDSDSFDSLAQRAMEWVRFPYAADALLDAVLQKSARRLVPSSSSSSSSSPPSSVTSPPLVSERSSSSSSSDLHRRSIQPRRTERQQRQRQPLPASVDWPSMGVLGPVKNQHINDTPCGCCWSFATTGVVEGVVGVVGGGASSSSSSSSSSLASSAPPSSSSSSSKRRPPPSLSEQQLIDCDRGPPFDDLGCQGGSVEGGVNYIVRNHGKIDTEEDYPYTGVDDRGIAACRRRKEKKKSALAGTGARVVGFKNVPRKSESALKAAVARHPVAVAVCCGDFIDDWHAYTGGIMTFNGSVAGCPKPLDHAVVVVGYGSGAPDPSDPAGKRTVDYWIVKNSWGAQWGENGGFFKLARGLSSEEFPRGAAGVLSMPNFPVVERVDDDDDDVEKDEEA